MFLESFGGGKKNHKELASQFEQLSEQLRIKHSELEKKEREIQQLSKEARKWTRKYRELELSISENVIDEPETRSTTGSAAHNEETKQLRTMLLTLNKKNRKLEHRLDTLQLVADTSDAELTTRPADPTAVTTTISESEPDSENLIHQDEVLEPEFSAAIQNQFQEYAERCA